MSVSIWARPCQPPRTLPRGDSVGGVAPLAPLAPSASCQIVASHKSFQDKRAAQTALRLHGRPLPVPTPQHLASPGSSPLLIHRIKKFPNSGSASCQAAGSRSGADRKLEIFLGSETGPDQSGLNVSHIYQGLGLNHRNPSCSSGSWNRHLNHVPRALGTPGAMPAYL